MEKYVITISRQYGSFGRLVAKKLSEQLHIDFLDRDIVEETAKRMNTSVKQISREEEIRSFWYSRASLRMLPERAPVLSWDAAAPTVSGMSRDFCGFIFMHLMKSA